MPIYQEIWAGPARSYKTFNGAPLLSRKKYVTVHNTSNDATAEGEASYAKTRTDGTSSHYYCDHDSILQSLNTDWCAGHVGSTQGNTYGISYEITGFNGWTRETWLSNVAWELLAAQMARDCREFGIPPRLLTIDEMRTGSARGFITHDMARIAWGGTDHTDPGPGFPMDHLLARVSAALNGDDMQLTDPVGYAAATPDYPGRNVGEALGDAWRNTHILIPALIAQVRGEVTALRSVVEQLATAIRNGGGSVDTQAILAGVDERLAAQRAQIEDDTRDAVADLGEKGAAGVRAEQG